VEAAGSIASVPAKGIGLVRNIPAITSASGTGAKIANTAARTGAFAAEGAALGTAGAVGYGNDVGTGAALGAALGPVGQAVGSAAGKVWGALGPKPALLSGEAIDALRDAKNAAYTRSEAAGVVIKPKWVNAMADEVEDLLAQKGWTPERVPAVRGVLNAIERVRGGNITLKGVDSLRQIAGNLGGTPDDLQNYLGRQIVKKIDKYVDRLSMTDVMPGIGNKTEAVSALRDARRLNTTMKKTETVAEAVQKAERLSEGQNTSFHKALQTQFRGILNSKTRRRGFSTEELAAMEKLARGSTSQALLGWVSGLAPSNKLSMLIHLNTAAVGGATTAGASLLPQAALAGTGIAAQMTGTRMARNNIYGLARLIREQGLTPALAAQVKKMPRARRQRLNRVLQAWNVTGAEVEP
jgi:hypothetical protein